MVEQSTQTTRGAVDDVALAASRGDSPAGALTFYSRARQTLRELFGYELAITRATLLGHARGDAVVPTDADVEAAYLSRHHDVAEVRAELLDIVCTLLARGEDVHVVRRHRVLWHGPDGAVLAVVPSWTRGADFFEAPGVGGPHAHVVAHGFAEVELEGHPVLVPQDVDGMLLALYGPEWRTLDVAARAPQPPRRGGEVNELELDDIELARVHWTRFYGESRPLPAPSPFAQWVAPQIPAGLGTVIELGCGNGRDTAAVAQGRRALGLDYSPTAIERNLALWPGMAFRRADVSDASSLATATAGFLDDGPVAVYSRFFLHAISDDAEAVLLEFLRRSLAPGSVLYLEFRTEQDADTPKVFGEHYRRFVDPDALVARFRDGGHFDVVHDERGHGLAVYKDEDPYVARLVLVKREPGSTRDS